MHWFEQKIKPTLEGYEVKDRYFENGDFGSLTQVEFNSKKIGGGIDFWGLGWLGIYVWDYIEEIELMNVLLEPDQLDEKTVAFEELRKILTLNNIS